MYVKIYSLGECFLRVELFGFCAVATMMRWEILNIKYKFTQINYRIESIVLESLSIRTQSN